MHKEKILTAARKHLEKIDLRIRQARKQLKKTIAREKNIYPTLTSADKIVADQVKHYHTKRSEELSHLQGSPYFVRCDIIYDQEEKIHSLYFGKFGFRDEAIYSWIAPASSMRFENPGIVDYRLPDGRMQKAQLLRKDQYMIINGHIKFLSTESTEKSRQLIFQEYFSNRKANFALPEIVSQMEKAQDQVIRAHHIGPFLISGPAGSGKTTLALHRVAYLTQSPDLAEKYPSRAIIVFVQDNGTKKYFSELLPELGINDVLITTFSEWAFSVLKIHAEYSPRFGDNEEEMDLYELAKLSALKNHQPRKGEGFPLLERVYANHFNIEHKKIFQKQKKEKILDKLDLTLLLKNRLGKNNILQIIKEYSVQLKDGTIAKKKSKTTLQYALAVIDEFQNYLPDQLKIINSCVDPKNRSTLYVGDMAQQVHFGTLKNWNEIDEVMHETRQVVLKKVYRNTKNILSFIRRLGYQIELPEGLKDGPEVSEAITASPQEEVDYIRKKILGSNFQSVGIIAKEKIYLEEFKHHFSTEEKIHLMTMNEAQGVEFDIVFLIGINEKSFVANYAKEISIEIIQEKEKINKDLLYVALTRAISELHILGRSKLEKIK